MNSRNHFALGACGQWYFEALAGVNIDPDRPGFKHIVIRPRPAGDLTGASADYPSMHGRVRSSWRIKDGRLVLELTIPANATATVHLPAPDATAVTEGGKAADRAEGVKFLRPADGCAVFSVGAGQYSFAAPWTRPVAAPEGKSAR